MSWTCPKCNRTFKSAHQWHSCRVVDFDIHMQNVPGDIKNTFIKLKSIVERWDKVTITPVKSSIQFQSRTTFMSCKLKKEKLGVEFYLEPPSQNQRIEKSIILSKKRTAHLVYLYAPDQVNEQFIGWIKESYDLINR